MEILRGDRAIWDLYTRKEEYDPAILDRFGRFPGWAAGNGQILEPLASRYLLENGLRVEYPRGSPFCICLTHDIDHVYRSAGAKLLASLRNLGKGQAGEAVRELAKARSRKIPWWNFTDIQALEENYGAKSTFFFKVQDESQRDFSYRATDVEREIRDLSSSGWEIGFHGGFEDYESPDRIRAKAGLLGEIAGKKVEGYRSHYINFRIPRTWEAVAAAGIAYDSTLGFADCAGFRNGMCHPFRPFNLTTGAELPILEIPPVIMDFSLFYYMRLSDEGAWRLVERLLGTVERYRGVLTILWHNTHMAGNRGALYRKILEYGRDRGAWMTGCGEVARWWADHEKP